MACFNANGVQKQPFGIADDDFDPQSPTRRCICHGYCTHAYHRAFVAEGEGQVVGFAGYGASQTEETDFDGELFSIYILQAVHKQGVGRRLVNAVVKELRGMGCSSMMVWVLKDNPARGFYERLGGKYLYEKTIQIGNDTLMEVAYGWRSLEKFPA